MLKAFLSRYRAAYSGLPREVWMLSLVLFVNRCGTMVMPFLTIYLTSQLGMTEAAAGRMISVYGLGAIVGASISGRLCRRFGALRVQNVCMFLAAPGYLLIGAWSTWPAIAASLLALSIVNEAVRPANSTAITQLTTQDNRTRAFSLNRLAANLGFSFGPAIGGILAKVDFRLLFLVDAATTLAAAAAMFRLLGMRRLEAPHNGNGSGAPDIRPAPLVDGAFVAFLALTLLSTMVFMQFGSTYPLALRNEFGMDEPRIGLMFAVNTSIIVLFEMLLIDAVRHWPLVRTIAWGSFLSCVGFGILPFGDTGAYAVLAMTVVTIGEMLSFPLSSAFVANRGGPGSESAYLGWYQVSHAVAAVLGPAIGAALYQLHRDAVWLACLGVAGIVVVGFQLVARRTGDQSCGTTEPHATLEPPPVEIAVEQLPQQTA